jgi:hypothetical protein
MMEHRAEGKEVTGVGWQNTENRIQITDDRWQRTEIGIRNWEGGIRKDWKTDVRFYFYSINLFNPVNKSTIYTRNP